MSENSFRVQLIKMKYLDASGKRKPINSFAFLIEEDEQVADRLGGELCDCYNQPQESFNKKQAAKVALFNYMIGNPDYDFKRAKNLKMIKDSEGNLTAIPYDFDFSAFVAPPYMNFSKMKGIERKYKAFNLTMEETLELKDFFFSKKETILQTISDFKFSSRKDKIDMRRYIKGFYEKLEALDLTMIGIKPSTKTPQIMSK